MILRMGQGSKCFIGLFKYNCPKLGISGEFDEDGKCYEYSTGTAVAQIFAFVALTFSAFFLVMLELVYFCKWKMLRVQYGYSCSTDLCVRRIDLLRFLSRDARTRVLLQMENVTSTVRVQL